MTPKTAFPPSGFLLRFPRRVPGTLWVILGAFAIYGLVTSFILQAHPDAVPRFRISLAPLMETTRAVQIHVAGAISTFLIGCILLLAPKGFRFHKTLGWSWVVAMSVTAISSFFITGLMGATYSPIHALSAWTMIGLPFGIAAIRRRDVQQHRRSMTGMFVGGMVIAGLFSFLPGRLMWQMFFAT